MAPLYTDVFNMHTTVIKISSKISYVPIICVSHLTYICYCIMGTMLLVGGLFLISLNLDVLWEGSCGREALLKRKQIELSSIWRNLKRCYKTIFQEEFGDTKVAIRIRISKKNRQHNGQKKKYKKTNIDLQNIHIKLKIE